MTGVWKQEWKALTWLAGGFILLFFLPVGGARFDAAVLESLQLARWYAREHVLLCLVPAFYIAGAIAAFVSQGSVMRYLGAGARKVTAYGVASVSGTILAVCSCTVLPLFAGIYRMGAGLGPAVAFLYSGPAINVLAIILTARILGPELGVARAVGAVIGLSMHLLYRREELVRVEAQAGIAQPEAGRPLWKTAFYFASMVSILVFANWGRPEATGGVWAAVFEAKWMITALAAVVLAVLLGSWFDLPWQRLTLVGAITLGLGLAVPDEPTLAFVAASIGLALITAPREDEAGEWFAQSWGFARQILPLLVGGVLIAGFLLGRPGHEGLIPTSWIAGAVGGNSLGANLFAAVAGAFMYFATLTEVPILQGLLGAGMGKGPALALLLAGPALSLPNMLVIRSVMGTQKTLVYVLLVVVMSTISGLLFGTFF